MTDPQPLVELPDLNLWLALAWGGHRHQGTACRYWEEQAADTLVFTTVTGLGLVRLLSQPSAVQSVFLEQPGVRLDWWTMPSPAGRPGSAR